VQQAAFVEEEMPTSVTMDQLLRGLFRQGIRPEGPLPTVDVLLSAPIYFSATGRQAPDDALAQPTILFYVTEDSHEELPIEPPAPELLVDGKLIGTPAKVTVLADSFHHRTTLISYAAVDTDGHPFVTANSRELALLFPAPVGWTAPSNQLFWALPIVYTSEFSSQQVALGMAVSAGATVADTVADAIGDETVVFGATTVPIAQTVIIGQAETTHAGSTHVAPQDAQVTPLAGGITFTMTWAAILAIMAGMLTALTPCLIQLVFYFTATLAAVSTEEVLPDDSHRIGAQRHVMLTGLFFALGFTLVYTAGGAAAGFIGQSMDRVGILITWSRPLSIIAGAIILVMALRVAWNARAPLVCHLPMAPIFGKAQRTGIVGSAIMGISFATGCLACFSATILPALLLYAGATGSVTYGALLLLVFSLGITVPCLLLAFGMSRLQPLVVRLQNVGPYLGLASATVMAAFGIIMLTDQFHLVSSLVYRYLGLS
jgi:cytochrome c-type biogenesis protein